MTTIVTFYRFFPLEDPDAALEQARELAEAGSLTGTMHFSPQGINATLAGERPALEGFLDSLESLASTRFKNRKWSATDLQPFRKLRMFRKEELLGLHAPGADPLVQVGTYVPPAEWNALIEQDDVVVVDVRNWYETYVGTFEGAVDPKTETFADFDSFVQANLDPAKTRRVAMYCTGGIRCEVATGYMLAQGFDEVFHLEGGILRYLEEIPSSESKWQGECFVFDERVSVDHELQPGSFDRCRGCSAVVSEEDTRHPHFELGVTCAHCYDSRSPRRIAAARERMKQKRLSEERLLEERLSGQQQSEDRKSGEQLSTDP